jgi:hypothetical protein
MADASLPVKRFTQPGRLSLASIAGALGEVPAEQPVLICADELVVDCPLALVVRFLDLHARILVCPLALTFSFTGGRDEARWRVFLGRIESDQRAAFNLRFMGLKLPLVADAVRQQGYTLHAVSDDEEMRVDVSELADLPGDALVLVGVLQAARAARVSAPLEATERAQWVVRGSVGDGGQVRLFGEAMQLLSLLRSPARRFAVVPYLNRALYVAQAQALADALDAVETDLRVVADRQSDLAARKQAAQSLLARVDNAGRLSRHLLEQSEASLAASRDQLERKDALLREQLTAVDKANGEFESGLERWRREQIIWASLKAAVGIGIAVASVCTANPAGAAAGTAAAAEAGAEVAVAAGRIARLIAAIKRIVDAVGGVEALKTVIDGLQQVLAAVQAGISAAELAARIQANATALPDAGAGAAGVAEEDWDLIVEDLGPLLQPAIDAEVPGASDYLKELRKLAIRGKARFFAQEHVLADAQEFMQMVWTLERDKADRAAVENEIAAIADGEPLQESLRLRFERARDDIKARVVLAIDNLAAAHHYFALDTGLVAADPAMSGTELRAALGRAADDLVQAFERFDPRPQAWKQSLTVVFDARRREQFARREAVSIDVPVSADNFPNYGRVRVSQVRAYLRGARCPPGTEILLHLSTSDHYRDRYGESGRSGGAEPRVFDFAGRPLRLGFGYRHRAGVDRLPAEGDVDDSVEVSFGGEPIASIDGVYFEPTPFTEWRVSLPIGGISGLDLSGCERLELQFSGSAVAMGFRAMQGATAAFVAEPPIARFSVDMLPDDEAGGARYEGECGEVSDDV